MEQDETKSTKTFFIKLVNSAILLTYFLATLYVWGLAFEAFSFVELGVPLEFTPNQSVQNYIFTGGLLFLLFYLPIIAVMYFVVRFVELKKKPKSKINLWTKINRMGTIGLTLFLICTFALSVFAIVPISRFVIKSSTSNRYRVKAITKSRDSTISNSYENFIFITTKGSNYIFAEPTEKSNAKIYILNKSEIKELLLYKDEQKKE